MTNQKFTVAGVSTTAKGVTKARFGNDMVSRIKKLKDNADINFVELPRPMTKAEAATFLLERDEFKTVVNRDALTKVVFRGQPKRQVTSVTNTPVELNTETVENND